MEVGDQWMSKDDLAKLDMPEFSVKVDHPHTGEEGYRVGVEVFHQLHCINLLRRVTYKDYYEPLGGEFAAGAEALQKHTGKYTSRPRKSVSNKPQITALKFCVSTFNAMQISACSRSIWLKGIRRRGQS